MRHIDPKQLILYHYGGPEIGTADRGVIEARLAACSYCRAAAPISAQARDRVLLAAVADHMERSEILLMELENAGEGGGKQIDISVQREQAQELAAGSRLYQQAAEQAGEAGLASLLDDLGRVLVTVGHSPSKVSPAELAELRGRVEGPGLVFKLRVVNSGIQQRLKPESGTGSGNVED